MECYFLSIFRRNIAPHTTILRFWSLDGAARGNIPKTVGIKPICRRRFVTMKNGSSAKMGSEMAGAVTPTSRLPCAKCGKVFSAQCLSAPDFREIMAAHNVGKPLADQIRWVQPKHVLAAARCDACKSPNGMYWPLVRTYLLCVVKSGGRSVQEQEFVVDTSYRAPMSSSDRVGEYHSLMKERQDHDGMKQNANRQRIARMAGTPWEDLPKGKKISRRAGMRNKGRETLSRSHNRVDEYEAQLAMGRDRLARDDED